eukprot:6800825-Lingulodinium_polyedra.AAC.1
MAMMVPMVAMVTMVMMVTMMMREPRWARCNGYARVQGQLNNRRVDAIDVGVPHNAPRPRSFQEDGDWRSN